MAVLLSELLSETQKRYKMQILAGQEALEVPVNWVHLVEDDKVADYFWGGELVVTTGVGQTGEHWLLELIQSMLSHQISGVIINSGMYIKEVPQEVIDFCNNVDLALITMPWEIHLADVIKDYCMRIVIGSQSDAQISNALVNAIHSPADEDQYTPYLDGYYDLEGSFRVVVFRLDFPESTELSQRLKTADILRTLLSRTIRRFSMLRLDNFFVLVLNNEEEDMIREICQQIQSRCAQHTPPITAHIGLGTPVTGIKNLKYCYRRARAAARMADYFDEELVHFSDMGLYQLLFTAEDPEVLVEFYNDSLKPLLDYDRTHNANLTETLYYHLLLDGSVKAIAEAMYTHRNTVNYRINKIRELLNSSLTDADERTRYWLAFYIRDIISKREKSKARRIQL